MVVLDELYHAPLSLAVFLVGFFVFVSIPRFFSVGSKIAVFLYFWHTVFSLVYVYYSFIDVADATLYYSLSLDYTSDFSVGTGFIVYFTSFFSKFLKLDYIGVFLVYNIIGAVGLLAFYASLVRSSERTGKPPMRLILIVVLLPSVSFWSSAIGKDSISFMAVGLSLWASLDLSRRLPLFAFSFLLMFLVRPHIAGVMLIALCLNYLFDARQPLFKKFILSLLGAISAWLSVSYAVAYAGLSEISVNALNQYVDDRQSYNMTDGGGVDISSMSLPFQLFTYMFRPLPFEAGSVTQFVASLDNTLILFLFIFGFASFLKCRASDSFPGKIYLSSYTVGCWVILSVTTANLGIAVRQKWMFLPMVICLLVYYISVAKNGRRLAR